MIQTKIQIEMENVQYPKIKRKELHEVLGTASINRDIKEIQHLLIPQKLISKRIVEDLMKVCFYIQMIYTVFEDSIIPSGELAMLMEWGDLS